MARRASLHAWTKFLEAVDEARDDLGLEADEEVFYRGQGSKAWKLSPSLFRGSHDEAGLGAVEFDLFFEFQAQARELPGGVTSPWDILFAMQHHGTPTRLLDWTDTLGVAIYFALQSAEKSGTSSPCVWLLNGYSLNEEVGAGDRDLWSPKNLGWDECEKTYYDYGELLLEEDPFWWDTPIAVYPSQRNPRMVAQRGFFTIHGRDVRPLDDLAGEHVRRVDLPHAARSAATAFLADAGINEATMFPELDGLSRWLKRRYGF